MNISVFVGFVGSLMVDKDEKSICKLLPRRKLNDDRGIVGDAESGVSGGVVNGIVIQGGIRDISTLRCGQGCKDASRDEREEVICPAEPWSELRRQFWTESEDCCALRVSSLEMSLKQTHVPKQPLSLTNNTSSNASGPVCMMVRISRDRSSSLYLCTKDSAT